jgi:stage IV sporulation protein FB
MHDPFAWSLPIGRLFGISVRIHWLFPFVALGLILHVALSKGPDRLPQYPPGSWIDASLFMAILFVSVLLHEFGHCFAARSVGGEANEVLLWPLGGLAKVDVPHRPSANFLTSAAGPAVNIVIALVCLLAMLCMTEKVWPPLNPLPGGAGSFPFRFDASGLITLHTWAGEAKDYHWNTPNVWLARIFWVNYFSALLNIVLVGFPLDGGCMLQAILWPWWGYRHATLAAVFAGFAVVFIVGLYAIIHNSVMSLCLALFIYTACHRQWVLLETGGEEGIFGYDFSQGYTSLERDQVQAAPTRPKQSWWRRWLQRRAQRRLQRELEQREAEEKRMDELLQKLHKEGRQALTDEEQRFMKRVSDRYRNNRR